ncbi:MAG: hypothetical protein ACT4OY_06225 [Alphaproteobacteria bacterium]
MEFSRSGRKKIRGDKVVEELSYRLENFKGLEHGWIKRYMSLVNPLTKDFSTIAGVEYIPENFSELYTATSRRLLAKSCGPTYPCGIAVTQLSELSVMLQNLSR